MAQTKKLIIAIIGSSLISSLVTLAAVQHFHSNLPLSEHALNHTPESTHTLSRQPVKHKKRLASAQRTQPPTLDKLRWNVPDPPIEPTQSLSPPSKALPDRTPFIETPTLLDDPLKNHIYAGHVSIGEREYALMEAGGGQEGIWLEEDDELLGFTVESIDGSEIRLRQGSLERSIPISDRFNAVPLLKDSPYEVKPDPGSLTAFRGQVGQTFYFQVTGRLSGSVWGSDVYTDDSALAVAAVHAGVLRDGQDGVVKVIMLPSRVQYEGSTRNGVTTSSYGTFDGSYRVDPAPRPKTGK